MILHQCHHCGVFYDAEELKPLNEHPLSHTADQPAATGSCPAEDCGARCFAINLNLAQIAEIAAERLDTDVLFDPGHDPAEQHQHHDAQQAITWLKHAVEEA